MTDPEGKQLCSIYLVFPSEDKTPVNPYRRTRLNWPKQGRPSPRSFCYWKKFVLSVANADPRGRLYKALGTWIDNKSLEDNQWRYYLSNDILYVWDECYNVLTTYSQSGNTRIASQFIPTTTHATSIPKNSCPVAATRRSNGYNVVIHNVFKSGIEPNKIRVSFDDYLDSLPQWEDRLLSNWRSVPQAELIQFLTTEKKIIAVSDGGCKDMKGSYGVVIGTEDKKEIGTVEGIVKGSPASITSFRCEAYGMLTTFVFIKRLCQFYRIKGNNRPIQYYCDGQSLLTRISSNRYKRMRNKDLIREDLDLELQILSEIKTLEGLGFEVTINFIRGHQELTENSPASQVFNHVADNLASRNLTMHNSCLPYDLLPTMEVIIDFNKLLLSTKVKETITNAVLFPPLYQENVKHAGNPKLVSQIWWKIVHKTLHKFSRSDRFRLIKFNYDILHTKAREKVYDDEVSDKCPNCLITKEDSIHILQCPELANQRQSMLTRLHKTMQTYLKDNPLAECIYKAIGAVVNREPIPSLESMNLDTSQYLEEAYGEQCKLGWEQFCKGRWSKLWEPLISFELRKAHQADNKRRQILAETWSSNVLFEIWTGVLECWEQRNAVVHGKMPYLQQVYIRTQLMKEVNSYIQRNTYSHTSVSINDFQKKPLPWIVQWLRHQRGKQIDSSSPNINSVVDPVFATTVSKI
jgi:hypothetical protein